MVEGSGKVEWQELKEQIILGLAIGDLLGATR